MYNCNICNYDTDKKSNYNKHLITQKHLNNDKNIKYCSLCDIIYSNNANYKRHYNRIHNLNNLKNNVIYKKNNINNKDNTNNKDINTIKNIINDSHKILIQNQLLQKQTNKEVKEVKKVVIKALNKASSLIKYLMENHPSIPPLKKINYKECINLLRIEFDCNHKPTDEENYTLEKIFIKDFIKGIFIKNISKSILNLVNYQNPDKQFIYNTDCSRLHYIIKTSLTKWYEDKSGIKFTDYIIKPVLNCINKKINEYIDNDLDKVNMRKNNLDQNIEHYNLLNNACRFERYVTRDEPIKLILKELSPYLRFIEKELQEFEKYNNCDDLDNNLNNNLDNDLDDFDLDKIIKIE